MADPIGAPPGSPMWQASSSLGASTSETPWTRGSTSPVVVGPVYFLYGGASVWVLVR
jgi:hypothetical protein